jgi:hypothetical protein
MKNPIHLYKNPIFARIWVVFLFNAFLAITVSGQSPTFTLWPYSQAINAGSSGTITAKSTALSFNGSSDHGIAPYNSSLILSSTGTIEAWVMPNWTAGSMSYNPAVLALRNGSPSDYSIHIRNGLNAIDLYTSPSGVVSWSYTMTKGTWYHLAFVYSSGTVTCYVNGTSLGSVSASLGTVSNYPLTIGATANGSGGYNEYFLGSMDEIRIWNTALSSTTINANKFKTVPANSSNLVAYYRFDEASGTTATDFSSTGNNGTINSSSQYTTATPMGNSASYSYTWSPSTGLNTTSGATVTASPTSSVTYTATAALSSSTYSDASTVLVNAGALNFDGVDDDVDISNPFYAFNKEITVDWWVNPTANMQLGSGIGQSTNNVDNNANSNVWLMHFNGSGTSINFYVNDNGNWRTAGPIFPTAGTWNHLVGVANASGVYFYLNGTLAASSSSGISSGIFNNSSSIISLGRDVRYNNRFGNMSIDEVRIYDRALCASEISAYSGCQLGTTPNNLQEYYQLNEGYVNWSNTSVTTLNDQSGHSRTGTLNGYSGQLTGTSANWVAGTVSGTCATFSAPTIALSGSGNTIANGSTTTSASNLTDFGTVGTNTGSSETFTITNSGTSTLTIGTISFSGTNASDFAVTTAPASSIAAGGSTTFTVTLTATATGTRTATISIANNDNCYGNNPYTFNLSGTAFTPATGLNFDGSNDYINVSSNTNIPVGNSTYTIEAWIKPSGSGNYGIAGWGPYGSHNSVNAFRMNGTTTLINYWWSNDLIVTVPNLADGNWHHVAATFDGTTRKIYCDGVLKGSDHPAGHNVSYASNLTIGLTDPALNEYLNGSMDEVKIWSRALCQSELQHNMSCEASTPQTGLVLYYKLNQGYINATNTSVNTATDASGSGNTGTLTNFARTGSTSNWSAGAVSGSCSAFQNSTATISGNNIIIPNGNTTTSTADNTNLGSTSTGAISQTYSISNSGNAFLTVTSIVLSGTNASNFAISGISLPASIATGNSATFTITFNPTILGTDVATVTVNNSDCNNPAYVFAIEATQTCLQPSITADPTDVTVCNGVAASFSVTATGTSVTYQWQVSVDGGTTWSNLTNNLVYSNTTQASMNIVAGTSDLDNNQYRCQVSGCSTSANSKAATFRVNNIISATVSNQTACLGTNVTFTAAVTNSGPGAVTYQWYDNGSLISGATGSSYTILASTANNSHSYIPSVTSGGCPVFTIATGKLNYSIYSTHNGNGSTSQYSNYANNLSDMNAILNTANSNTVITSTGQISPSVALSWGSYPVLTSAGISIPNGGDYFGTVVTGTFVPKETGTYTFGIASDDGSDLQINGVFVTNDYGGHGIPSLPGNTGTISLTAGVSYTLKARMQEYNGGEGLYVVWKRPSQSSYSLQLDEINPQGVLTVNGVSAASVNSATVCAGTNATFTVNATYTASSSISYQWYGGAGLALIPGATSTSYVVTAPDATYNNNNYECLVTASGCPAFTAGPGTLTVNDKPVLTCNSNINANTTASSCDAPVSYTTTLSGSPAPALTYSFSGATTGSGNGDGSGSVFNKGTTTVTVTATNTCGTATCSFTVTINDNTPPVASAKNITVTLDTTGNATITASQVNNGSSDACGSVTLSLDKTSFNCSNLGPNTVTLTVTDGNGNTSTATATVTVKDTIAPGKGSNLASTLGAVPANILSSVPEAKNFGILYQLNIPVSGSHASTPFSYAIDNSGKTGLQFDRVAYLMQLDNQWVWVSMDPLTHNLVQLGIPNATNNNVAWQQTVSNMDVYSNVASITTGNKIATGNVEMWIDCYSTGAALPGIGGNGSNYDFNDTRSVGSNCYGSFQVHNWGAQQTLFAYNRFDGGGNADLGIGNQVGGSGHPDWTFATNAANYSSRTLYILVGSSNSVSTNNITAYLDATGHATITPAQVDNNNKDNCSIVSRTLDKTTFDCTNTGANTVTLTLTDGSGNISSGTATVTVVDNIAPTVITKNISVNLDASGSASITAASIDNGTTDNCTFTLSLDKTSFNCLNAGPNTVTLTATDASGNTSSATATVTVIDNINPVAKAKDITVYLDASGNATASASDVDNGSTDNCGIASETLSQTNFSCTAGYAVNMYNTNGYIKVPNVSHTQNFTYEAWVNLANSPAWGGIITLQSNVNGWMQFTTDGSGYLRFEDFNFNRIWDGTHYIGDARWHHVAVTYDGSTYKMYVDGALDGSLSVSQTYNTGTHNMFIGAERVPNVWMNGAIQEVRVWGYARTQAQLQSAMNSHLVGNEANLLQYLPLNEGPGNTTVRNLVSGASSGTFTNGLSSSNWTTGASAFAGNPGTASVTLTVQDRSGNTSTATSTVTILDNISPTVRVKTATLILNASGQATLATSDVENGSSDNCKISSLSLSKTAFTCADLGANTVYLTVTDGSGNQSSAPTTVTVVDNTAPTVRTKNITVNLDAAGNASIQPSDVDNGTFDNCRFSLSVSPNRFNCSNTGANTVTLTATDASNNVTSATATVTVLDNIAPMAITKNITVNLDPATGKASIQPTDVDNGSYDNCRFSLSVSPSTFDCSNTGSNTVTLTATDASNNVTSATATVTIVDQTAPTVITKNITVNLDATTGKASILPSNVDNGTYDNCHFSLSVSPNTFDCSNTGANTVTLTATDASNNITSATATVTIVDNTAPTVITKNITVNLDASTGKASIQPADVDNGSYDNCRFALSVSPSTFDCSNTGANTVTLSATDASNNVSTQTAIVTIVDNTAPTVLTKNITIYLDATTGKASIQPSDVDNGTYDNCRFSLSVSPNTFDCSNTGANTVTLSATDASNNVSTQTATVTIVDQTAPTVITKNITVKLDASTGKASIQPSDVDYGTYDNCKFSLSVSPNTFDCSNTGTNTVTLTATDASNNVTSATATVTIVDNTAPTVITKNITVNLDATTGKASIQPADVDGGSYDNCSFALSVSPNTFDCSNTGANTVTLTATDASSNVSTQTATVTIVDNTAPTVITKNITVYLDATGSATIVAADVDNGSYDNCKFSLSLDKTSFDCSNEGANTVALTATDASNNSTSATATVTVEDKIAPTIITKNVLITLDANNSASISTSDIDNGSYDNCTISSMTLDKTSFDCSNVNANTVTLTVTDNSGNVSTGTAIVTVKDPVAPVAHAKNVTVYLDASGQYTLKGTDVDNGSTDNCGIVKYSLSKPTFGCSDVGTNLEILTVSDAWGNTATATCYVTVIDSSAPVIKLQNINVYLDATGHVKVNVNQLDNGTTDNCSYKLSFDNDDDDDHDGDNDNADKDDLYRKYSCHQIRPHKVTVYATDPSGNVSYAIAYINVIDSTKPVVKSMDITVYLDHDGDARISGQDVDAGSTDNCQVKNYNLSRTTFNCSDLGPHSLTYFVTDASGNNSATVSVIVTVKDNLAPQVEGKDLTVYLDANGRAMIHTKDVLGKTWDNCSVKRTYVDDSTFTCADLGKNTTIHVYATDPAGNVGSDEVHITVKDNIAPTIHVKNITVYLDGNGKAEVNASDLDNGTTDNCGALLTFDHDQDNDWDKASNADGRTRTFDCSSVGTGSVTVYAFDKSGNVSSAVAQITVKDTIRPVAIAKSITVTLNNKGQATISAKDVNHNSDDNCSIVSMTLDKTSFSCSNVGDNTVTLTVKDASGNSASTTATVTVQSSLSADAGKAQKVYYGYSPMSGATLSGSASGGSGKYSYKWSTGATSSSVTVSPSATTMYYLTVTDGNGCTATDSVEVTAINVHCGTGGSDVMMCQNGNTICVKSSDVAAYLKKKATLGSCSGSSVYSALPDQYGITLDAYPNPFNEMTVISFTVPEKDQVKLELYNMKGEKLQTIYAGEAFMNNLYTFDLKPGYLAAGIYMVRLTTSNDVQYIKLMKMN